MIDDELALAREEIVERASAAISSRRRVSAFSFSSRAMRASSQRARSAMIG
jgi:hypothetical protein